MLIPKILMTNCSSKFHKPSETARRHLATLGTVAPLVPQPAIARAPRSFEEVIAESGLEDWSVTWLREKGDLNGWCHRFLGAFCGFCGGSRAGLRTFNWDG